MLRNLWNDEAGFIISAELVLVATIVVIGLIVGLVMVRNQVVQELADVAQAIGNLSQTYCFPGIWVAHHDVALTDGACFRDVKDWCQTGWSQASGEWAAGIAQTSMPITTPPGGEQ
jgi:uncharacterized membrane protein YkgB